MAGNVMKGDASGRGAVEGFRVSIPARQRPYTEAEIAVVVDAMRNVQGQTQGAKQEQFQKDFAAFTGAKHAFAVANATNALSLAATLCGVRPGDEVIVPAYTFCASAIPFGKEGAKIVWGGHRPRHLGGGPQGHRAQDHAAHPRDRGRPPAGHAVRHGRHHGHRRQARAQGRRGLRTGA